MDEVALSSKDDRMDEVMDEFGVCAGDPDDDADAGVLVPACTAPSVVVVVAGDEAARLPLYFRTGAEVDDAAATGVKTGSRLSFSVLPLVLLLHRRGQRQRTCAHRHSHLRR